MTRTQRAALTPIQRRLARPLAAASAHPPVRAQIQILNGRFGPVVGAERIEAVRQLLIAYQDVRGLPHISRDDLMEAFGAGPWEVK